jgi:hypothetical protein
MSILPPYSVLMPLAPWELPSILNDALYSLALQSLPPKQVVVSCDGPPAASLNPILERTTLPTHLVVGPGNEGVGPVLARGLEACLHELVVRADADDISLPERCATQVAWMANHPRVIVLGSAIDEFHGNPSHLQGRRIVPIGSEHIALQANSRNPMNHPSVIFRRQAILDLGSYRSKPGFEDYDLWLRVLAVHGRAAIANIPESLVYARVGNAHLARRHGLNYALAESRFFWSCGREGLLDWSHVLRALVVRIPLRLLPKPLLSWVMGKVTRESPGEESFT